MPPDDELARYLATLDHGDLVRRLRSLAERDDSLRLALTAEAEAAVGSIDLRRLKKELASRAWPPQLPSAIRSWRHVSGD